jgi:NADH dehydrogenase (ubiquinone) Fe-S protein 5
MASGFGINGNTGRCFPFIQDFTRCMAENESPLDEKTGCKVLRDDYLECLYVQPTS